MCEEVATDVLEITRSVDQLINHFIDVDGKKRVLKISSSKALMLQATERKFRYLGDRA